MKEYKSFEAVQQPDGRFMHFPWDVLVIGFRVYRWIDYPFGRGLYRVYYDGDYNASECIGFFRYKP